MISAHRAWFGTVILTYPCRPGDLERERSTMQLQNVRFDLFWLSVQFIEVYYFCLVFVVDASQADSDKR